MRIYLLDISSIWFISIKSSSFKIWKKLTLDISFCTIWMALSLYLFLRRAIFYFRELSSNSSSITSFWRLCIVILTDSRGYTYSFFNFFDLIKSFIDSRLTFSYSSFIAFISRFLTHFFFLFIIFSMLAITFSAYFSTCYN